MSMCERIIELEECLGRIALAEGDLAYAINCVGVVIGHIYGKKQIEASRFMRGLRDVGRELGQRIREAEAILPRLRDEAIFQAVFNAPDR